MKPEHFQKWVILQGGQEKAAERLRYSRNAFRYLLTDLKNEKTISIPDSMAYRIYESILSKEFFNLAMQRHLENPKAPIAERLINLINEGDA